MVWESRPCAFCGKFAGHDKDSLGPLLGPLANQRTGEDHYAHRLCALWSPEVFQSDKGTLCNVLAAIKRSRALRCSVCGVRGASIGCRVDACHQSFHLACAGQRGCLFNVDNFVLACPKHAKHFRHEKVEQRQSKEEDDLEDDELPLVPQNFRKRNKPDDSAHIFAARAAAKRARFEARREEDESSDDEEHFRRKEANRLSKDRMKLKPVFLGGSHSVNNQGDSGGAESSFGGWETVGGLEEVVKQLKEMVMFPLVYPEVFGQLGVSPPRGILLHGEPGSGKTLVARALAGACAKHSKKPIAFFARKGADCLGKFSGEAERTLRLLFEEAAKFAPSIIFLDELDGLLPSRSTREGGSDQIYASVVTTMLALMDGLSDRGSVIVIAATNRPEGIDPALRRPGRFDREVYFGLPSVEDRLKILQVHTGRWAEKSDGDILKEIAKRTDGFAGADLQSLCCTSVLTATRRCMPDLSNDLLSTGTLDSQRDLLHKSMSDLKVTMEDWKAALSELGPPCSRRSGLAALSQTSLKPTSKSLLPILLPSLRAALANLHKSGVNAGQRASQVCQAAAESTYSDEDFGNLLIKEGIVEEQDTTCADRQQQPMSRQSPNQVQTQSRQPSQVRLLLCGDEGLGQELIADAIQLLLDGCPVQTVNLPSLIVSGHGDAAQGMISQLQAFSKRNSAETPVLVYLPKLESWATESSTFEAEQEEDGEADLSRNHNIDKPQENEPHSPRSSFVSHSKANRRKSLLPSVAYEACSFGGLANESRYSSSKGKSHALDQQRLSKDEVVSNSVNQASNEAAILEGKQAEIEAVGLTETWRVFEQIIKEMPTDRQLLILATSNYCPRSFPAILSNFFSVGRDSRDLHGLSIAEVSGQQKLLTHGIVELQKPSSQVLLGAQQEQRRKATQQALSEGARKIKQRFSHLHTLNNRQVLAGQAEASKTSKDDCKADNLSKKTLRAADDQLKHGTKLFAQVAHEIAKQGSQLVKDPRCKLVVGEVSRKRQQWTVSLLDVAKQAESGHIFVLDDFLAKTDQAIEAAKSCAAEERRYSARKAAACALSDELQCWKQDLGLTLDLQNADNLKALQMAEVIVHAELSKADQEELNCQDLPHETAVDEVKVNEQNQAIPEAKKQGALVDPIVLSEVMTQEGSTQTQDKENRDNLAVRSSSSASHQVLLNEERQQASKSFASLEATLKEQLQTLQDGFLLPEGISSLTDLESARCQIERLCAKIVASHHSQIDWPHLP